MLVCSHRVHLGFSMQKIGSAEGYVPCIEPGTIMILFHRKGALLRQNCLLCTGNRIIHSITNILIRR